MTHNLLVLVMEWKKKFKCYAQSSTMLSTTYGTSELWTLKQVEALQKVIIIKPISFIMLFHIILWWVRRSDMGPEDESENHSAVSSSDFSAIYGRRRISHSGQHESGDISCGNRNIWPRAINQRTFLFFLGPTCLSPMSTAIFTSAWAPPSHEPRRRAMTEKTVRME